MSFKDLMTYKRILIRHIYTSVISWCYSVRHAQHSGQTVILGAQTGLLPYSDPDLFVPFLEDKSTGLWLLPLLPPPKAHNGVYLKSTAKVRYNCKSSAHCYHQHQAQIKTKVTDLSEFFWFDSEFNSCLIAPLKCVHIKKTNSNVISAKN